MIYTYMPKFLHQHIMMYIYFSMFLITTQYWSLRDELLICFCLLPPFLYGDWKNGGMALKTTPNITNKIPCNNNLL